MRRTALFAAALFLVGSGTNSALFRSGGVPAQPVLTPLGGQVFVELTVDEGGNVGDVCVLRSTPPFTEALRAAVSGWRFSPAEEEGRPRPSHCLVAAVFRPPELLERRGGFEPPNDVTAPSEEVPFPVDVRSPRYPPNARGNGVVVVETVVGTEGSVLGTEVVVPSAAFDSSALEAAHGFGFRPARRHGRNEISVAYLVFGFREPVVTGPQRPPLLP